MDPRIVPVLENTLQCVVDRLDPEPGRIFVAPGGDEVAHDDCCDGQVWTRLSQMLPVVPGSSGGGTARRPVGCLIVGWTAVVEIGVVRCAATVDSNGNAPTVEAVTADAYQAAKDVEAVMQALECCVQPFNVIDYSPTGPEGGCVGGVWTVTFRLDACGCA